MSKDKKLNEVIRVHKRANSFVMMDKEFLENAALSWKAKGILAYLLSKPDNWKVIAGDLVKRAIDGKTAVYNGLAELSKQGYYEKVTVRSKDGRRIDHWESTVYELPKAVNPENTPSSLLLGFQEIDNQEVGNQDIGNRERNNNYVNNKDFNNNQSSQVMSAPPNRQDKDATDDIAKKIEIYTALIKENISYNELAMSRPYDLRLVDEIVAIIIDTILTDGKNIRIDGEDKPRSLVKSTLLKLNYHDIILVLDQFKTVTDRISKKNKYILTMLYNSKLEGELHYTNLVNHDTWQ